MNYRQTSRIEGVLFADYVDAVTALAPAVFSLPTLFLYPSLRSVALIITGAIAGAIFFYILCTIEDLKRQKECLSGFLRKFSQCSFSEYPVEDYSSGFSLISQETESINKGSFFGYRVNVGIKRNIRVYVVKRGASSVVPTQMTAYEAFFQIPSIIFVRDEPHKITPLGRFFIYHEVGHASHQNSVARRFSHIGWKFFILPVFWAIINLKVTAFSYSLLGIYILLLVVAYPIFKFVLPRYTRPIDEAGADLFSVSCLSKEERENLQSYLGRAGKLPNDPLLTPAQNSERYSLLLSHLEKMKSNYPTNESIIMIYSRTASYYLFILAVLVPIMGFLSREPSFTALCINIVCLLILISVAFGIEVKKQSLSTEIQSILQKNTIQQGS